MKSLSLALSTLGLAVLLVAPTMSYAGAQQNKMKTCNADADAKGLSGEGKGEDRKAFMKTCLSAKPEKSGKTAQQTKMKTCNKDATAKSLKGADRKKFMSECLAN